MDSTIHTLLPEVLSHIFLLLEWMGRNGYWPALNMNPNRNNPDLMPQLQWIFATQVCSRWRNIALDMPLLWANQIPDHPMLAALFLERSKDVGLSIRLPAQSSRLYSTRGRRRPLVSSQDHGRMKAWHELVKPHLHRARVLQISSYQEYSPLGEMALEALSTLSRLPDMPYLQELTVSSRGGNSTDVLASALPGIFPSLLSSLRSLHLSGCALDWEHARVSNLTSLQLTYIPNGQRLSMSRLLELLENSPCIEDLIIIDALEDWASSNLDNRTLEPLTSRLSLLRSVHVAACWSQTFLLLESIVPSKLTRFVISLPRDQPDPGGDLLKLGAYLQKFIIQSSHVITAMYIGWIDAHKLMVTIGPPEPAGLPSDSDGPPISLHLNFVQPSCVEAANRFMRFLPLARLQRLYFIDPVDFDDSFMQWKQVLLLAREVKTLEIMKMSTACHVLELLAQPIIDHDHETSSSTPDARKRAHYLLSQLQEVSFGDVSTFFDDGTSGSEPELFSKALGLFVRTRAAKIIKDWEDSDNAISRMGINDAEIASTEGHRRLRKLMFVLRNRSILDMEGADFRRIRESVEVSFITRYWNS